MTIYDMVGNLRMFVNCNKGTEPCNLYSIHKNNKTGIKGVRKRKVKNGYRYDVYITKNKKSHHIGTFKRMTDAISARKMAEMVFFGENPRNT